MTFRHGDVFDKYSNSHDLLWKWTIRSGANFDRYVGLSNSTPYGQGQSLGLGSGYGQVTELSNSWSFNDNVVYFSANISPGSYFGVALLESNTVQVFICFNVDGSIAIRTSDGTDGINPNSPIVASAPSGTFQPLVWNYFVVRVVIGNSGSVEIRINGSETDTLNFTEINTQNGTSNAYVNGWALACTMVEGGVVGVNSPLIWSEDSVEPGGWLSEVRGVSILPNASIQSQFTINGSDTNYGTLRTQDGDITNISTVTVGSEDIVAMDHLATLAGSGTYVIYGVQPWISWRRTAAGLATGQLSISANESTDTPIVTNNTIPSTYCYNHAPFMNTDPTSATWTEVSVDSIKLGIARTA